MNKVTPDPRVANTAAALATMALCSYQALTLYEDYAVVPLSALSNAVIEYLGNAERQTVAMRM